MREGGKAHRRDAWPPASPSGSASSRGGPSNSESLSSCHAKLSYLHVKNDA